MLDDLILWIKGGSDERTKTYGGRNHQHTLRSGGLAGERDIN